MSVFDYEGNRFERELQLRVNEVLHYIWDPIGIRGVQEARDEYDAYVPEVYSLLQNGATAEQLAAHLDKIATEGMGFSSNLENSLATAKELLKWQAKLLRRRPEILG
jgi:hypothetical protein